jgi:hypothetical protein
MIVDVRIEGLAPVASARHADLIVVVGRLAQAGDDWGSRRMQLQCGNDGLADTSRA